MTQKKNPTTSNKAYQSLSVETLTGHWSKIIFSLYQLGKANYDTIAIHCGLKESQVARRMDELSKSNLIWKPGTESKTSSGHDAFDWQLTASTRDKLDAMDMPSSYRPTESIRSMLAAPIQLFHENHS